MIKFYYSFIQLHHIDTPTSQNTNRIDVSLVVIVKLKHFEHTQIHISRRQSKKLNWSGKLEIGVNYMDRKKLREREKEEEWERERRNESSKKAIGSFHLKFTNFHILFGFSFSVKWITFDKVTFVCMSRMEFVIVASNSMVRTMCFPKRKLLVKWNEWVSIVWTQTLFVSFVTTIFTQIQFTLSQFSVCLYEYVCASNSLYILSSVRTTQYNN